MALVAGSRAEVTVNVNGTEESRRQIETVGGSLSRLGSGVTALHATLGAVGALAAVAAFGSWIKGAIDATDAASDLSQKTGVAVKDLAGLELAYKMGGMEADALASTQTKLSKAMVDGNEGLERLGISAKNLDGSLKSNKEVLYSVADSFAAMEDGAAKTALAMTIFGKSGTDMIPMLNGGSAGLRELDEMAAKLGLTLSDEAVEQAGAFNDTLDLLMLGGQGVARGIAAELLPTLSKLAGSFLTSMTEGDRLKNVAHVLASGLKVLYSVGVGIVEVFSSVGKVIGGLAAMLVNNLKGAIDVLAKVADGDFRGAWDTVKRTVSATSAMAVGTAKDVGAGWVGAWNTVSEVWSEGGNELVDTMAKINRKTTVLGQSAAETKKAAAEASKARGEEAKILAELSGVTATYMADLSRLNGMYEKGTVTQEQYVELVTQLIAKQPGAKKAMDDAAKAAADYKKTTDEARAAVETDIETILEQVATLELKVATYGMLPEAITAVQIAELEASKQSLALTDQGVDDIQRRIDALKRLQAAQVTAQQQETAGDAAKKMADDGKRAADSIESSLTDALMRGFESGKGFAANLVDTVKNLFKTMVLRPIVSAVVNPVAGAVTGALGLGGTANAASVAGGGSGAGGIGMGALGATVGSYFGAGGIAGSVAAGAGWLTGATTLGGSLTAAGSLAATGTLGGIASSLGMVVGALGPIALGIGAAVMIWKKLDTSGTYHAGGAASATSAGVTAVSAGSLNMERIQSNAATQQMVGQLAQGVVGILDSTALAFGKTAGYQAATAFADDTSKDGAWGSLVISKMGQSIVNWQDTRGNGKWSQKTFADGEKGQEQYLAALTSSVRTALDSIGLPDWAKTMLNGVASDATLEDLAKVVEQINGTQVALAAMRSQLAGFASMSDAAVSALMAASGGIDSLFSNASAYYDAFYSEAEKNSTFNEQIAKQLAAVNLQMPATKEGYRALVEAQMRLGTQGAESVSVLLANAAAFAQLHPAVEAVTSDLSAQRSALADAYNAESDALQSTTSRLGSFAASLRNLKDNALLSDLSPLSPQEKYAEAARQFEATLAAARADDPQAQANFEGVRTAFLEASRAVNSSSMQYQQDFAYAQRATEETARWAETAAASGEAQLAVLKAQVSSLIDINKSVLSVREALEQYNQAMGRNTAPLTAVAPPAGPINYSAMGASNTTALVDEIKGLRSDNQQLRAEVVGLRGEQRQQTGDLIKAQFGAADESSDKIAGRMLPAKSLEYRVAAE